MQLLLDGGGGHCQREEEGEDIGWESSEEDKENSWYTAEEKLSPADEH